MEDGKSLSCLKRLGSVNHMTFQTMTGTLYCISEWFDKTIYCVYKFYYILAWYTSLESQKFMQKCECAWKGNQNPLHSIA